jgi:hypothetical protein
MLLSGLLKKERPMSDKSVKYVGGPPKVMKNAFCPATALHGSFALLFVIPSEPGFPTSPLSPAITYVVLPKENHMQLTEAATLDRKSGGAEGSAVPRTFTGNAQFYA